MKSKNASKVEEMKLNGEQFNDKTFLDLTHYDQYEFVDLNASEYEFCFKVADIMEEAKNRNVAAGSDTNWGTDGANKGKRWRTGILAERAVELKYGIAFINTTVGKAKDYNCPDLFPEAMLGVKASEPPKCALFHPSTWKCPQIVCVVTWNQLNLAYRVYLLGLGYMEDMAENADRYLALDPKIPSKMGIYGYDLLRPLPKTTEELFEKFPVPAGLA